MMMVNLLMFQWKRMRREDDEVDEEDEEDEESDEVEPGLKLTEDGVTFEVQTIAEEDMVLIDGSELPHAQGDYDPKLDLSSYNYPHSGSTGKLW